MKIQDFIIGKMYNRRRDIHAHFGGQRQGGICTPAQWPVIFAFTGASGAKHGYADEWTVDGTLRYFGEGQSGDMTLTKGNKAIAEHIEKGEDLFLFETLGKGQVRFRGMFSCTGYAFEDGQTQSGSRKAIVFNLVPLIGDDTEGPTVDKPLPPENLRTLRDKAYKAAGRAPQMPSKASLRNYYERSKEVRRYVLARAAGVCESCDQPAPFLTTVGSHYLEPHHIRRLSDGGPDNPQFMGAICPNCHREIHHGKNGRLRNEELQKRILRKEN